MSGFDTTMEAVKGGVRMTIKADDGNEYEIALTNDFALMLCSDALRFIGLKSLRFSHSSGQLSRQFEFFAKHPYPETQTGDDVVDGIELTATTIKCEACGARAVAQ